PARARRGCRGPVRLRHPLSGGGRHGCPRCPLPHLPARPHHPPRRHAMTLDHRLEADAVTLAYGDRTVVEQLDLDIAPGRITAIVGANGCGKSTLLRALARLMAPTQGRILLAGEPISS